MKKHLLLLSVAFLASASLFAGPRTPQQAKQIAAAAAQRQGAQLAPASSVSGAKSATGSNLQPYYIFNKADNKGFVIVSGDDQLPEVIGETSQGSFDGTNEQLNDFLKTFASGVKKLQANDPKTKAYAETLKSRRAPSATDSIGPLIGSQWNQYSPYNVKCPTTSNTTSLFGSHAASGCVATAMSQIMYYYKWPKQLKETIPAYATANHGYQIAEVPAGKTYQWDKMKNAYTQKDEEGMDVVGTLLADVGASVKMDYNDRDGESTAFFTAPKTAFPKYWDYNASTLSQQYKSNLTLNTWDTYIFNDIKAKRPVMYADNSHCVVLEGYRGRDSKVYVNWGWGGAYNGWYDIDALYLDDESYMNNPSVYVGIVPNDGAHDTTPSVSSISLAAGGSFAVDGEREADDEDFTGTVTYTFNNNTSTDFKGYVALGIEDVRGFQLISDPEEAEVAAGDGEEIPLSYSYPFVDGTTYTIYAMVSYDGKTWVPALDNTYALSVTASEYTLEAASGVTEKLYIKGFENAPVINLTVNTAYTVIYTRTNGGLTEDPGVSMFVEWANDNDPDDEDWDYILNNGGYYWSTGKIAVGATKTLEMPYTPDHTGSFSISASEYSGTEHGSISYNVVDPTGINNIAADKAVTSETWYSLTGSRLAKKPVQPGVYVHNGKKVVVK